ncbi:Pup--protein ligase [Frankliniella fusca]|uniref:Pup--protein ligase n=1 Tax=Frankliniella fusca TaxID=407009 RepID=A0AAE1HGR6_9NEOP|nr:Pup--protein ligase [Frankliniella fusca]
MTDKQLFHLSNSATRISSEGSLSRLKSHFLWVCSTFNGKQINKCDTMMCPRCCEMWNSGKFSLKAISKSIPGPRMNKILRKFEIDPGKLTRVESSLLRRHQNNNKSKLVLVCAVCNNETSIPFTKQTLEKTPKCQTPHADCSITVSTQKKKKKDRFAGLNASAVMSATASPFVSSKKNIHPKRLDSSLNSASPANNQSTNSPRNASNNRSSMTPVTSKVSMSEVNRKSGNKPVWKKMQSLREEIKLEVKNKIKEQNKALTIRNLNVKKNNKLQDFISRKEKDVHLEDRINSLLQI